MAKLNNTVPVTGILTAVALVLISVTLLFLVVNISKVNTNPKVGASNPCTLAKVSSLGGSLTGTVSLVTADQFTLTLSDGTAKVVKKCSQTKITAENGADKYNLPWSVVASGMNVKVKGGNYVDAAQLVVYPDELELLGVKAVSLKNSQIVGVGSSNLDLGEAGKLSLAGLTCLSQNKRGGTYATLDCSTVAGKYVGSLTPMAVLYNKKLYVDKLYLKDAPDQNDKDVEEANRTPNPHPRRNR